MSAGVYRNRSSPLPQPKNCASDFPGRILCLFGQAPRASAGAARKRAKLETFLIFNQQFLTLIRAGLPILSSLEMLAKNQKNPTFSAQLQNVSARVLPANPSHRLSRPRAASRSSTRRRCWQANAAATSKRCLAATCRFSASLSPSARSSRPRSSIPALLITLVFGLFIFLITFVVPRFALLYDQIGTKLPGHHALSARLGNGAQHYILYILPCAAIIGYLLYRWSKNRNRRRPHRWHPHQASHLRQHLAQVSGRPLLPDALDSALRRLTSGTVA